MLHSLPATSTLRHGRFGDAVILIAGIALWTLIAGWVLEKAGSALPASRCAV